MTTRIPAWGGKKGVKFDDGVNDHVKKVIVGEDSKGVVYVKIEYVNDGLVVERVHGTNTGAQTETEFEINYPDEYITTVRATFRRDYQYETERDGDDRAYEYVVSELQFKTSNGRASQVFGKPGINELVLEGIIEMKFAGLLGHEGRLLSAIGAHFIGAS